jgi:glucose-1-phosphate thymidylyltransferase
MPCRVAVFKSGKMKALILCGGFATRLAPITYFVPKPLLPVGIAGKPIVEYIVADLINAGVNKMVISTNEKFSQQFKYWAKSRVNAPGISIKFVVEKGKNDSEKMGQIRGIAYDIEKASIDSDLAIIAGDNIYDLAIKDVIAYFNGHRKPTVVLYDTQSLQEATKFGVVELSGDRIVSLTEKPAQPKSTLVSTGIYILPREMLGLFAEYLNNDGINHDSMGYFVEWLIHRTEVRGYVHKGEWYDIGTLDTYKKVFDEYNAKMR